MSCGLNELMVLLSLNLHCHCYLNVIISIYRNYLNILYGVLISYWPKYNSGKCDWLIVIKGCLFDSLSVSCDDKAVRVTASGILIVIIIILFMVQCHSFHVALSLEFWIWVVISWFCFVHVNLLTSQCNNASLKTDYHWLVWIKKASFKMCW